MKKLLLSVLLLILFAGTANAAAIYCKGKVSKVFVRSNGDVLIFSSWRNNYSKLCNLKTEQPGTVTCSMWASYAAQAVDKQLVVLHSLNVSGNTTCETTDTYGNTPETLYLMLLNEQ